MRAFLILIAIAVYFAVRKVRAGLGLDFEISLPYSLSVKNGQLVFLQPVKLTNNSPVNLTVQSINLSFQTEQGAYIGQAILPTSYYLIPGRQSATIAIEVRCNIADLVRAIPDIRQQVAGLRLAVRYIGTIRAEFISIPVNEVFTMDKSFFSTWE